VRHFNDLNLRHLKMSPAGQPLRTEKTPMAAPVRRRGRPPGGKTAVLRDARVMGRHHFAFLRAVVQGLDMKTAWLRYMAFGAASDDLRHIAHEHAALWRTLQAAAVQIDRSLPPEQRLGRLLGRPAGSAAAPGAVALPSLEEFARSQGLDPEHHSQAELQAEYQAFHGLDQAVDGDGMQRQAADTQQSRIRALTRLESLLARAPQPGDSTALWFANPTLPRLHAVGAASLGALRDHIDLHGHGWYKPVRGLGARRAQAVVAWLAPLAMAWGRPLRDGALQPPQRQQQLQAAVLQRVVLEPRFAIVPLQQLAVPATLAGGQAAPGVFATRMANSLGAADDLAAIRAWLAPYAESAATHRAYAKEVERFYLWCLHVRRKPLSSVDSADCLAYRRFLADLPAAWVQRAGLQRGDPSWRPFRGPLKPSSQRYALVVVQTLFDGLREANYLVANPMVSVRKKALLPEPAMDTGRSFTDAEWACLLDCLDQQEATRLARPAWRASDADATGVAGAGTAENAAAAGLVPLGAEQRRLRLVLELLCSTGLRLSELVTADTSAIETVRIAGESGADALAPVITVIGKGRKQRQVPLDPALLPLIDAHHADAAAVGALPSPVPLVCTLRPGVGRWVSISETGAAAVQLQPGALAAHRALGASGLYRVLKRFFEAAAADAHAVDGLSAERLRAASTHWLRHTFGRQAAAAGVPVEVLQQAFGHASLNTTTQYLSTERNRMVREMRLARERRKAGV